MLDGRRDRETAKAERTNRTRKSIACQQGTIRNEGRHDGFESPRGPTYWIKTRNRVVFFFRARLNLLCKHSTSSAGAIRRFSDPCPSPVLLHPLVVAFLSRTCYSSRPFGVRFYSLTTFGSQLSSPSRCHYSTTSPRTEWLTVAEEMSWRLTL